MITTTRSYVSDLHSLLFCCRVIYAEVAAQLYSTNQFAICYEGPGSFEPVLALTAPALSSLRSLKIILNQATCHHRTWGYRGLNCCTDHLTRARCQVPGYHAHQLPLLTPSPAPESSGGSDNDLFAATEALLSEWQAVASRISSFVPPGKLNLSLVCDIDPHHKRAVELAASVLAPLRLLRPLRDCHIRLAKTPDARLSRLVQQSALEARGLRLPRLVSAKPLLLALPREIRLRILESTDLVTPNREVWWCRQDSKYTWLDEFGEYRCRSAAIKSTCSQEFLECWHRPRYRDTRGTAQMPFGCFCRRRHAASSSACACWLPPTQVFLICREMCRDAELVFFSANRFIIHDLTITLKSLASQQTFSDLWKQLDSSRYPFPRLAASHFLREAVPARCIGYLRFVEFVFPPYGSFSWPQYSDPAVQDWRATARWLQDRINGPGLTFRVVAAEPRTPSLHIQYPAWLTVGNGDRTEKGYMTILHPLAQLAKGSNGLARFYADLHFPWEETEAGISLPESSNWVQEGKRKLKKRAESLVLGDRYASQYANGKQEPEMSLWKHMFSDHP